MSYQEGTRWIPQANGGMQLQTSAGTALLTVSSVGVVTYGAAATTGAMRVQSMTTAQRDALTGVAGMLIYNSTTNKLNFYAAAAWEAVTSA